MCIRDSLSTDPEFESIFQFSDYDVYWLGRQYGDWEVSQANRTRTSGPLSSKLAEVSRQPGAVDALRAAVRTFVLPRSAADPVIQRIFLSLIHI